MIAFTTVNLTPDSDRLFAWLAQEGSAWFQSMTGNEVCGAALLLMLTLAGALLVWGRGLR